MQMAQNLNSETDRPGIKVFELREPFEYRGARFEKFTARHPKVRDMRLFLKEVDRDAIMAMEKTLSSLMTVDELVIAEMGIQDFSEMKKWFESFLKHMMNDSEG